MDINYSAPVNMLGYGLVGMNHLRTLFQAGHEATYWPVPSKDYVEAHPSNHGWIKKGFDNQATFNQHAPSVRHYHQFDLAQHVGRGPRIGSTVFELNRFNDRELRNLSMQDGICVPTEWAKKVVEEHVSGIPILVLPHGVDREIFNESVEPLLPELRKGNPTIFINIGKWEIRKGHDILVEAFNKAFEPSDNVLLILNCHNPFYSKTENEEWENLYAKSKMGMKVFLTEERLSFQQDVAALMATADCGLFPARTEGWGFAPNEMMAMGKHIILSNYAGHTGFANRQNSLLIEPGPLEPAFDGKWFFGQGEWPSLGEDQLEQLVTHMRKIHTDKQNGTLGLNLAGIETSSQLTWRNAIDKLTGFLENF